MPSHLKSLFLPCALLTLASCDWVDSTGVQNAPTGVEPVERLTEETEKNLDFTSLIRRDFDRPAQVASWIKTNEGPLEECSGLISLVDAAASLDEACSPIEDACSLIILQALAANGEPDAHRFTVSPPQLSKPVGVTYQWTFNDDAGKSVAHDVIFCIEAFNDAPVALDDEYQMSPEDTLIVDGVVFDSSCVATDGSSSVLVNDTDDLHFNTECLTAELLTVPSYASNDMAATFTASGGFEYLPAADRPTPLDSFTYRLFDGQQYSDEATVTLRSGIKAVNDAYSIPRNSNNTFILPLTNDLNPFNSELNITEISVAPNRGGDANVSSGEAVVYRPRQNFRGVERFSYSIQDVYGQTSTAVISITVQ